MPFWVRRVFKKLYDLLGVSPDADEAELKKGYRKQARKTHPDRGGNEDDFVAVKEAYMILRDPVKRKQYDETGGVDHGPEITPHAIALQELANLFQHLLLNNLKNIERVDIFGTMRTQIDGGRAEHEKAITDWQTKLRQLDKAEARLTYKNDDHDIFQNVIGTQRQFMTNNITSAQEKIDMFGIMLGLLDDWKYDFDQKTQNYGPTMFITTSTTSR